MNFYTFHFGAIHMYIYIYIYFHLAKNFFLLSFVLIFGVLLAFLQCFFFLFFLFFPTCCKNIKWINVLKFAWKSLQVKSKDITI